MIAAETHGTELCIARVSLRAHTGLRIDEALSRGLEHLALEEYLDGRETGPLFVTRAGRRTGQPEAWRMVRRLARRASLDGG